MIVPQRFHQLKPTSQLFGETRLIVSIDGQTAAFFRAVDCKRSKNDVTAGRDSLLHARDVGRAVRRINQKMEGCPIMPDVILPLRLPDCRVRDDPMNLSSNAPKARLGSLECGLGQIENGDILKRAINEMIDQT